MFFFKPKKVVVDAFIASKPIYELFPIEPSKSFYPEWWKNLPSMFEAQTQTSPLVQYPTIKRCDGFTSLYKSSFTIPLWADLIIETEQNDSWKYIASDEKLKMVTHDRIALGQEFNNLMHFKIMSPWVLSEKSGVKFLLTNAWWNNVNQPITIPNGIVDFKYQSGTHINFFLPRSNNRVVVESGTPITHIIPLSEREVEIKCHLISQEEYDKKFSMDVYQNSFIGKYRKKKKILDNKRKCPFNWR